MAAHSQTCQNKKTGSCKSEDLPNSASVCDAVEHYKKYHRQNITDQLNFFKELKKIDDVLRHAGLATDNRDKRYSHQRRILKTALEEATTVLNDLKGEIKKQKSFADLISILDKNLMPIKGISHLYIYDTALRIGAHLNIYPEQVYLHAGTQKGAKAFLDDVSHESVTPKDFCACIRKLEPYQIEDFLCIYKKHLLYRAHKDGGKARCN